MAKAVDFSGTPVDWDYIWRYSLINGTVKCDISRRSIEEGVTYEAWIEDGSNRVLIGSFKLEKSQPRSILYITPAVKRSNRLSNNTQINIYKAGDKVDVQRVVVWVE